ncbi:hypothetical protein CYMTET_15877 [Cymbomonas tetramitiformis]|uniref:Uncharacterized protein n=1 Tax=Cymbomonas tetramitiformis TaxID=36881 RepID=A0AAE0GDB2_9CHLO|nr:hypothetical protein CYMTET_15877 [Cymbomonas tetramitiformis]
MNGAAAPPAVPAANEAPAVGVSGDLPAASEAPAEDVSGDREATLSLAGPERPTLGEMGAAPPPGTRQWAGRSASRGPGVEAPAEDVSPGIVSHSLASSDAILEEAS